MNLKKITLVSTILLLATAWYCWPNSDDESTRVSDGAMEQLLVNRIWIDKIPTTERDKIDVFVMIDDPQIGAFSKSSSFEGEWAMFEWDLSEGFRLRMLQTDTNHKLKAMVMKDPKRCAPFDYCLKLRGAPKGVKKYGSMEDWIIPNHVDYKEFVQSKIFGALSETN